MAGQVEDQAGRRRGLRSMLGKVGDHLGKTTAQFEADELREASERLGGTPIDHLADRQVATICGSVRAVTLRPRVNVPALVVDLYDGSRSLNLVWLGRRTIGGIVPGTYLKAEGRVSYVKGTPTIFNPSYEIVPGHGS